MEELIKGQYLVLLHGIAAAIHGQGIALVNSVLAQPEVIQVSLLCHLITTLSKNAFI